MESKEVIRMALAWSCGVVLLMVVTSAGPGILPAQEADFQEAVEVRVVEIDVRVTDKAGRPVTGLTVEDFFLFEDGQPVAIEYFSERRGQREGPKRTARPDPIEDTSTGQPALESATRPVMVLYFDHLTLMPADRRRVLRELPAFIDRAVESARVMLATFDGGLSIVVPPTTDPAPLRSALESLPEEMTRGGQAVRDRQQAISIINEIHSFCLRLTPDSLDCGECVGQLTDQWRIGAEQEGARTERSAGGLLDLVKTISALDGQKAVIYIGSGLARMPGIDLVQYLIDLCPARESEFRRASGGYDLGGLLQEVAGLANARGVTVHSLDAGGIRPLGATSVDQPNVRYRESVRGSDLRNSNLQSGLFTLAHETGGQAILNANRPLDELTEIVDTLGYGYSIGFTPSRAPDRRVHRLRVHLTNIRKKFTVTSRRSYVDHRADDLAVERLIAAVQLGPGENPLAISAWPGEIEPVDEKVVLLPVEIEVPLEQFTPVRDGEATERTLRVLAVAVDSEGRRTVVRRRFVPVPAEATSAHRFHIRFKVSPDQYRVGVSLEADGDGRISYVVVEADATR